MKLQTDRHEASRGLSVITELLVTKDHPLTFDAPHILTVTTGTFCSISSKICRSSFGSLSQKCLYTRWCTTILSKLWLLLYNDLYARTKLFSFHVYLIWTILLRDAMHSAEYAVARCPSVHPSVCPSVTRRYFIEARLNVSSDLFQLRVAPPFYFFCTKRYDNIPTGTPLTGRRLQGSTENRDFQTIYRFISEMIQDLVIVTVMQIVKCIPRHWTTPTQISRSCHNLTLNISETVKYTTTLNYRMPIGNRTQLSNGSIFSGSSRTLNSTIPTDLLPLT